MILSVMTQKFIDEGCDDLDLAVNQGMNEVEIIGVVENATMMNSSQMRVTISVSPDMKRMSYIQVVAYKNSPVFNQIKIGEKIHAIGFCGTRDAVNREGKKMHYEDIVISSLL